MSHFFTRGKVLIASGVLIVCAISLFIYLSKDPEKNTITVVQAKVEVKAKKPVVKLRSKMISCNKLQAKVSTGGGFVSEYHDYIVAKGVVENIGKVPVQFVQVQVIWKDKADKNIDANTIFAVTDDTLQPGEKETFETSIRNYKIQRCASRVVDWWVVDENETYQGLKPEPEL